MVDSGTKRYFFSARDHVKHGSISIRDCRFHISLTMTMFRFMIGLTLNWMEVFFMLKPCDGDERLMAHVWQSVKLEKDCFSLNSPRCADALKLQDKHWHPCSRLISNAPWILLPFFETEKTSSDVTLLIVCLYVGLLHFYLFLGKSIIKPLFYFGRRLFEQQELLC